MGVKKIVSAWILVILNISNVYADSPDCEALLTLADIESACSKANLEYKKSPFENGKKDMFCVREFRLSFANRLGFNLARYSEKNQADSYEKNAMISDKNKAVAEKLAVADGGFAFHTSDKVTGERSVVRLRKGNSFVEIKYQHSKREKPFCDMNGLKTLAEKVSQKL
ncbi:hypothetical protein [Aliikangiella sp. G2MR2-5]|uniref:hypothetical protein n=1 Tax=Aliikangiella sp. G2MR2-5 TaxID=2788943 RepID=UPI0018A9EAAE|nr:hypothetical protein [Aliikangiella sp. G2MR2-5]